MNAKSTIQQQAWAIRLSDLDRRWIIEERGGETIGQPSKDVISAVHKAIDLANDKNMRIATLCRVGDGYLVILDEAQPSRDV